MDTYKRLKKEAEKIINKEIVYLKKTCNLQYIKEYSIYRRYANLWFRTQKVLRLLFNKYYKEKCKDCKNCCCKNCRQRGDDIFTVGYFKLFDFIMFEALGYKIPTTTDREKGFLGSFGCKLEADRRSKLCVTYTCMSSIFAEDGYLFNIIKSIWESISYCVKDRKELKKNDDKTRILNNLLDYCEKVWS